jgi:hypothetical protein
MKYLCCGWIASFTRCIPQSIQNSISGCHRDARPGCC